MLFEDLRTIHEDLERLEQGIADRILEDPRSLRDRLARDHQIAGFLDRIETQSKRGLELYADPDGARLREVQAISTGDPFDEFYKQLGGIKDFHKRYPNEPVENLERAYKRRAVGEDVPVPSEVDNMFSGEEAFGRFFDLTASHEDFVNLPGTKRRITYLQYLDSFDDFSTISRKDKMRDQYFQYVGALASYLESFMRRTKPLEDLDKVFASFDREFDKGWEEDKVQGWEKETQGTTKNGPVTEGTGEGIWCADCAKPAVNAVHRLKERAVAEREYRVRKLAAAMSTERADTRVNVERRSHLTDKERQQELQALYAQSTEPAGTVENDDEDEGDDKIYNPLKLPLAWDGKPIPFWLYKLHGLGVEFPCEICGNFVYMGRRAFDKHFSEARHLYGLKCLGITNSSLFREITGIEEAKALWDKIQKDKKKETAANDQVVQMEDKEGNVMPEKVYNDLMKQGLL
ncbi:Pre-mRNA-splicing factor sap61 [Taxawa tesnikishii (nom. ined.)]|nr:Pre-mRNA-splicing factor sap61 [Dothideales sp. JES 119]